MFEGTGREAMPVVMTDCGQISKDASALWVCLTTNEVAGKLTITYRCGIVSLDFSSVGEAEKIQLEGISLA